MTGTRKWLTVQMLNDNGVIVEECDALLTMATCDECNSRKEVVIWTTASDMQYALCLEHLAQDAYCQLEEESN